jgi:hypothetical protein
MKKLKISGEIIKDERNLNEAQRELNGLRRWEKRFRADARADNYELFRNHLRRLGLPEKPELLLEGTINVIQAIWVFANRDRQPIASFLANQQYDQLKAPDPHYIFTFDLCGKAYARVIVNSVKKYPLDLADLFGYPWYDYKVAGFESIWISHPDWSSLTSAEVDQLEIDVIDDLLFDYSDDEIFYGFDDTLDPSYLFVCVEDRDLEEEARFERGEID